MAERTIVQIAYAAEHLYEELRSHETRLGTEGRGNSRLAYRIRDYLHSIDRLLIEAEKDARNA